jgi:hypothetical protein
MKTKILSALPALALLWVATSAVRADLYTKDQNDRSKSGAPAQTSSAGKLTGPLTHAYLPPPGYYGPPSPGAPVVIVHH